MRLRPTSKSSYTLETLPNTTAHHRSKITITGQTEWLWWKWKHKTRAFVGACTVWHELPYFRRPGTVMEGALADMEAFTNYQRERDAEELS